MIGWKILITLFQKRKKIQKNEKLFKKYMLTRILKFCYFMLIIPIEHNYKYCKY